MRKTRFYVPILFLLLLTENVFSVSSYAQTSFETTSVAIAAPRVISPALSLEPDWQTTLRTKTVAPPQSSVSVARLQVLKDSIAKLQLSMPPAPLTTLGAALPPRVEKGFFGFHSPGIPNDDDMAISNSGTIVSVMNGRIAIHHEDGTLLRAQSLSNFAHLPGLYGFDPHVLYDPEQDAFVVVFITGTVSTSNTIHVLVSATADPLANWYAYQLPGSPLNDGTWSDFPAIALSKDELYLTCNTFTDGSVNNSGFRQSVIWQLNKHQLMAGATLGTSDNRYYYFLKHKEQPLFNITPVRGSNNIPTLPFYFLSNDAVTASQSEQLLLLRLTSPLANTPALELLPCTGGLPYTLPPNVRQPNPAYSLGRNDARIMSAFLHQQRVHFVMNVLNAVDNNPRAGIYYGKISSLDQNNPTVNAQLVPEARDASFPSIAYAGLSPDDHAAIIVYAHASLLDHPGYSAVFLDKEGNFSVPLRLKEGEDFISVWGDYTGICVQYNKPGVVWGQGCVSVSTGLGSGGERQPHLSKLMNPTILGLPAPGPLTTGKISPNPAVANFQVVFPLHSPSLVTISLHTLQGKQISLLLKDHVRAGESTFRFSTGALPAGVYVISITSQNKELAITQKLVVTR